MNYVLFFPDEMRAESLHCYGNEHISTPNFDLLAEEGTLFEQCHVLNTVCSPSRCAMFTGQYVHNMGHRTLWNLIKPYEHNLLRYMKEAGYEVRVYGKNDVFDPEAMKLSTDVFERKPAVGGHSAKALKEYGQPGYFDFLYDVTPGEYTDNADWQNLKAGMDFIRGRKPGDKPFVLFLPLTMPHCPYTVQEPYYSMYDENDVPQLRPRGEGKPRFHELIRKYRGLEETNFKKIQAVYMGMVSFADQLLGEMMDCIRQAGIEDETMLIAAADHGDYAGDYDLVEKWPSGCEDVLTRVPLIVRAPGKQGGVRVKEPMQLFDIMPTILEDAGVEAKHTHYAKSFLAQLDGEPGDPMRAVYCEGGYNREEPQCNEGIPDKKATQFMLDEKSIYYPKGLQQFEEPESVGRATMIRTMTHKLVRRTYGDHELYDLEKDPLELVNVYDKAEYAKVQAELEMRLLDWYIATADAVRREEDPR